MESTEPGRVIYPIEVLGMLLNLVFGACCLVNLGKAQTAVLGIVMDREHLYAHYFIDVAAGIPVGIALYFLVPRLEPALRRAAEWADAILARRLGFRPMAAPGQEDRAAKRALRPRRRQ